MSKLSNIFARIVVGLIRAYQYLLSPWLGPHCRYSPSCSEYAVQAIRLHGSLHGGWLTIKRLARCHPWATSGYDPVPSSRSDSRQRTVLD
ncbi:MAG: membrane protein insertion efficiency factor YidD [Gammaproteobacteria bacterium]